MINLVDICAIKCQKGILLCSVKETLIILVKWLSQSFQRQQYDCNSMIRLEHERLQKCFQSKVYSEQQIEQYKSIQKQISIFIWQLSVAPKYWVMMLNNEQIFAKQTKSIDLHTYTNRIYKKIEQCSLKMTPYFRDFILITGELVFKFLEQVSMHICEYFNRGRKLIVQEIDEATQGLKGSTILNIYTLFKILRDISRICKNAIVEMTTEGMFKNIETEIAMEFAHFIIEKHEVLKMEMKRGQNRKSIQNSEVSILDQIIMAKSVSWREAVREDGQKGILIQLEKQPSQSQPAVKQDYIIKVDTQGQIQVINGFSLTKRWKMQTQAEKNHDIIKLVKNKKALAQKLRDSPINPKTALSAIDHVGTVGGSLGRCLADIDQYNSVGQFMTDLSKRTAISGSINYLLQAIPMLGYIFVAGGFTYSFYYILTNKVSDNKRKFQDIGKITIDTASTIGSGFLGAIVGQSLIPVPFLGAFIGGVVGSLVGQVGGKQISKFIQSARFNDTIRSLRKNLQPKGCWQPNKTNLQALGLNKEYFYESIPSSLQNRIGCDRIWISLISFTLLSFYFADERDKFMKKKLKELKKKKVKLLEDDVVDQEQYDSQMDILLIMAYLQQEDIIYVKYIQQIEKMISQMYSRLK